GDNNVVLSGGEYEDDFEDIQNYIAINPPYTLSITIDDFGWCDNEIDYVVTVGGVLDISGTVEAVCDDSFTWDFPLVSDLTACIPACPAPTAFQVTGVTPATASLSWSGTGNFIVEYGLSGFTQGTGTEVPVSGTSTTLSPLTEGQAYQAYIVKDCGGGIKSAPVGPVSFTPSSTVTYTGGNISTMHVASPTTSTVSNCPGTLTIVVPEGKRIASLTTEYTMTATEWKSEQRSYLYSPTLSVGESQIFSGTGNSAGIQSYSRSVPFLNGATGTITVELRAFRTYSSGESGTCNITDN